MSSFQLNLSSLTLGAMEHLARLDSAGGALRSLLSPSPSGLGASVLSGTPPPAPSDGFPVVPGGRLSVEQVVASGVGHPGESSVVAGGLSGGLLGFVVKPELRSTMCCGAVAGGVEFCTLGAEACTFTTHSKKVEVHADSLYISTGRNSAFTHHHAPVAVLTQEQLTRLLEEAHPKEEWVRLIWGFNQALVDGQSARPSQAPEIVSVLDTVTPGWKRKVRFNDDALATILFTPAKAIGEDRSSSFDSKLVILLSEDSTEMNPEDKLASMWAQWNTMVGVLNRMGSNLQTLQSLVSEDVLDISALEPTHE